MYHQSGTGLAAGSVVWNPPKEAVKVSKELGRGLGKFYTVAQKRFVDTGIVPPVALEDVKDVEDGKVEVDFSVVPEDASSLLRPDAVESFFVLYRVTGDEKYREWGWRVFRAMEQWAKLPTGGYSGVKTVNQVPPELFQDAKQAESQMAVRATLKYLFLLFSDSSLLPLDQNVFNTESHPLPVFQVRHTLGDKLMWLNKVHEGGFFS
ncbi:hypothetical protein HDU98_003909 [Podochytrium sp. JEL0797]|nr:hypothetical protein HDU98_003909 [Podochytrium sp. JEL0797]